MNNKNARYRQHEQLHLPQLDKEVLAYWDEHDIFQQSVSSREGRPAFVFYEGPPSANGMPGIHHVLSRTIKDLFCRYKTLKGFQVKRKGGWDTHGLPVELGVEKLLGITKEDIGNSISIAEYNAACRKEVMRYKDSWDDLTRKMGYWVDLDNPYITFENDYIETLWNLLHTLYKKGLLYKGYTIQPFSPAAGTGLSSHELNLPGCYRDVKDTSMVAQFRVAGKEDEYLLAWTTTPWTLPSNTALTVGPNIEYVLVDSYNPYTDQRGKVWVAAALYERYFNEKAGFAAVEPAAVDSWQPGEKPVPFAVVDRKMGRELAGIRYEQLLPYAQPTDGNAFVVITGDFVTTEDGTGIVHTAPSFGADDMKVARENGIGSLTLVDRQGKFVDAVTDFAGRYVKNYTDDPDYVSVDVDIAVLLKQRNRAFKIEKYEHSYPHCWRTDKPIIYYPLDSWFIRTTALKERMVALNKTINWKPEFTGTGRFGNWLENLVDWNLSRSRYWGTPLPIWVSEGITEDNWDDNEVICIGSVAQLKQEVDKAVAAGVMDAPLADDFDLHRPYVDDIVLVSPTGKRMYREPDLIDVWFDSGAMPYAQWHYPFEQVDTFRASFPADFIAEGVDQTRGWFFTLHALAVMLFDDVAFKNVVSNGLVLDKNGNKMSKRLGNAVDPFTTIAQHGADATRWYMIANSQPWDNLKFDEKGIEEVKRKFFGTLFNTYSFFALYANIDGFTYQETDVPVADRPEIDRWIMSLLHSLIKEVDAAYAAYEPTRAARAIQTFVNDHLSNWYVRLCRRRFWKGDYNEDKVAAYQTLYTCLEVVSLLMSPISPFFADRLFSDLNAASGKHEAASVHLAHFPQADEGIIDTDLEERMQLAQDFSSMVLSLRKKENIKVRQPLARMMIPVLDDRFRQQVAQVEDLILSEVNVKEIEYLTDTAGVIKKRIRPDFKQLGARLGGLMKPLSQALQQFSQEQIRQLEQQGYYDFSLQGEEVCIQRSEVEITSEDIPGWLVANEGPLTVALDITITDNLLNEGNARELVNRIQRLRKEKDFNVTDRIQITIERQSFLDGALNEFNHYICAETLANTLEVVDTLPTGDTVDINEMPVRLQVVTL